jgi:threonine/homoserine/homoserine lactone efflux protein
MIPALAAYTSVTFAFAATPGATTTVVVRNAIEGGIREGVHAAEGAALANGCQAMGVGLGLATLLRQFPRVWAGVQLAGALYLVWLGIQGLMRMWRGTVRVPATDTGAAAVARGVAWRQGLVTNLLNPSISTFYLAIVPTFLPPGARTTDFLVLAAIHISLAFLCHCGWATAFHRLRTWFARPAFARIIEGALSTALLWLAWRLVVRI